MELEIAGGDEWCLGLGCLTMYDGLIPEGVMEFAGHFETTWYVLESVRRRQQRVSALDIYQGESLDKPLV